MTRVYVWCCRGCKRYFETATKITHPVYCGDCDPEGSLAAAFRRGEATE